jgi:hypothetical protein
LRRQDEIATLLDIAPKTPRKAFRRELNTGAIEANARVAALLYSLAVKERNVPACWCGVAGCNILSEATS